MSWKPFLVGIGVIVLLLLGFLGPRQCAFAQKSQTTAVTTNLWQPLEFLVGNWQGNGSDEDASATGATSFQWEVGHRVLVRRDYTKYKASAATPAFTYEALMVIYENTATGLIEADYFDSGNHSIHYKLAAATPPGTVQFIGDAKNGPTFRLTYKRIRPSSLNITFEMSAPGSAGAYHRIASGIVRRKQ